MNEEHKRILRTKRCDLVDAISDVKKVVNRLYQKEVLTQGNMEDILEAKQTNTDRRTELLNLIQRRGPKAFNGFLEALEYCEEWAAMDILKPGMVLEAEQANKSSVDEDLTSVWPDGDFNPLSVEVKLVKENNQSMIKKYSKCGMSNSPYYCIQRATRGKVLIINNHDFSVARGKGLSADDREGTDMDATSLDLLFKRLHFKVDTKPDLTAQGIKEAMQAYSQEDHTNADCFVCCILSHGTRGGVYGTDGEVAQIQELINHFSSQNCLSLAGKPKLFFIQACQGNKVDAGSAGATSLPASVPVSDLSKKIKEGQDEILESFKNLNLDTPDADSEENVPSMADFFVAFATTPDKMAIRDKLKGTWFFQAVICIFQNHSHSEHLLDMMTKVNKLVSDEVTKKGYKQVSNFSSSFRKKFYFFPGLFLQQDVPSNPFSQVQASS